MLRILAENAIIPSMNNAKICVWKKTPYKVSKEMLNNLKKGVQIGVLATALTAGTVLGAGCAQDEGGTKDNEQIIGGGNTNNATSAEPYDRTIGNGNYVLHNFISDNFATNGYTEGSTEKYLDKGKNYIKGLMTKLNTSLNGRPAAQNYLGAYNEFNNNMNDYIYLRGTDVGNVMDVLTAVTSGLGSNVLQDMIKNLDTPSERGGLYYSYRILANESYKEGLGSNRNYSNAFMDKYEQEKDSVTWLAVDNAQFANIDFDKEYGSNNFRGITNIMDQMINKAVTNMNNRKGLDLRASDLRQVVNMTLATHSLKAMHDNTKDRVNHRSCGMSLTVVNDMDYASKEALAAEQNQGMTY